MSRQLAYVLLVCGLLCGCSRFNLRASTSYDTQNPIVTIRLEDEHQILIELYPEVAPNTVNNFISLIEEEYYDGLIFHRIIEDYIIQGGDPIGDNYGSPGYTIHGEFTNNGFKNKLKHLKGTISMARGSSYDSAGSQFFITLQDATTTLDGSYAAFGKVIQGMEIIEAIASNQEVSVIEKMTVDTKRRQYPDPIVVPIDTKKSF